MNTVSQSEEASSRGSLRRLGWILVVVALVPRLWAAWTAYPVQGDAAHFVECGVELSHGHARGLSLHWSQVPIFLAAGAVKLGLHPGRVVQASTVLAGLAVPLLLAGLLRRWTGSVRAALLAGLAAACNPRLIEYSVNGLAEMPFLALLLLALNLLWIGPLQLAAPRRAALAYLPLGLAIYYRPAEATVSAGLLAAWHLVACWRARGGGWGLVAGLALFVLGLFPITWLTHERTGVWSPSSKVENIAFGPRGNDSKYMYGEADELKGELTLYRERGLVGYLWARRVEMSRWWISNALMALRLQKECLWPGAFQVGAAWMVLLLLASALALAVHRRVPMLLFLASWASAMPALLALSFIFPRWMVPWFPFTLALQVAALDLVWPRPAAGRRALAALLGVLLGGLAIWGAAAAADGWRGRNARAVAEVLRTQADPASPIMSVQPTIALEYYGVRPFFWVKMPYGTVAQTLEHATRAGVRFVVVADRDYAEWPIQSLWRDPPPAGWRVAHRLVYTRPSARWGEEQDRYLVLEPDRSPSP